MSDDSTRARVIDAAISCILDEGFYRASSNKIARRAGVTWGVIQYHFGTREALLLAVHEHGLDELARCLSDAVITGETIDERLGSFVDALWAYYRRPEFLAYMQVMLNLSHDPTTAESTLEAMQSVQAIVLERMPSLVREVLGDEVTAEQVEQTGRFVYNVVRGLALDQELIEASPLDPRSSASEFDAQRARLVRVLARSLESDR